MGTTSARVARRLGTVGVILALALVAACGSDDEDDGKATAAGQAGTTTSGDASPKPDQGGGTGETAIGPGESRTAPPGASDEEQIRATLWRMKDAIAAQDGKQACANMTAETRAVLQHSVFSCAEAFESLPKTSEDPRPRIVSIKVNGKEAVLIAKAFDGPKRVPQRTTLVKEDGEWKVEDWFVN